MIEMSEAKRQELLERARDAVKGTVYDQNATQPNGTDGPPPLGAMKGTKKPAQQSILDRLTSLSATNRIEEMESNLSNDFYIFDDMALGGVITLFYAWPNTGKTLLFLHFIIESIKKGRVSGNDVFYINADDNYKGLYTKAKIAKDHGFHMISPQEAGVAPGDVLTILQGLAHEDEIKSKVIIMDTLKKFTDMMNKNAQAALYDVLRMLVTKGASVIIAGHANKHKDHDGRLIYEGTADTMNDIDCAYSIYQMSEKDAPVQVVEFRREKDRGDIIAKVTYQYEKRTGMNYMDIINSVERLDGSHADMAIRDKESRDLLNKYESEILVIESILREGTQNQTDIINQATKNKDLSGEISRRSVTNALEDLTGIKWDYLRGQKNAKWFRLIGPRNHV